tara:strand:- start:279 stop:944 length:666 start_codon:yes stop_codon:yes gene_type:complete
MKSWPWIVVFLYGLIIAVLISFTHNIAFYPTVETLGVPAGQAFITFVSHWSFWVWVFALMLSQALLLSVPVAQVSSKSIKKKKVILPITASALMVGILFSGLALIIGELITHEPLESFLWWLALGVLVVMWLFWAWFFYRLSLKNDHKTLIDKICNILFKGSILELLVAIPTHIYVRSKDYCCAGMGTFVGIAIGIAVMLFSFGPGVLFLYYKRCKNKHSK